MGQSGIVHPKSSTFCPLLCPKLTFLLPACEWSLELLFPRDFCPKACKFLGLTWSSSLYPCCDNPLPQPVLPVALNATCKQRQVAGHKRNRISALPPGLGHETPPFILLFRTQAGILRTLKDVTGTWGTLGLVWDHSCISLRHLAPPPCLSDVRRGRLLSREEEGGRSGWSAIRYVKLAACRHMWDSCLWCPFPQPSRGCD